MRPRRPEPKGFDEDMDLLIKLQEERERITGQIDEVFLQLAVDGPIATIAERLNVSSATVSVRRRTALKRQAQRAGLEQAA